MYFLLRSLDTFLKAVLWALIFLVACSIVFGMAEIGRYLWR